ncbi:MAG: hypothetical protein AB1633_00600 [Elusimicrobiota bacterium]
MTKKQNIKIKGKVVPSAAELVSYLPVPILTAIIVVWSWLVLRNYLKANPVFLGNLGVYLTPERFPPAPAGAFFTVVFDSLISFGVVFFIILAAFGAGEFIRKKIFAGEDMPAVMSTGIGITALVIVITITGMLGLFYALLLFVILNPMVWRSLLNSGINTSGRFTGILLTLRLQTIRS